MAGGDQERGRAAGAREAAAEPVPPMRAWARHDDDALFNVVGEVLPAAHVERVLRDYDAGRLGDADLEERLLRNVDERQFRAICQNALEGLASKKLNLEMLIERRARTQERRLVSETIARFIRGAAEFVPLVVKLLVEMLEPYRGRVYAPCCGSWGMFVQSVEFIRAQATGNGNLPAARQRLCSAT